MTAESRIHELKIELPPPPKILGVYRPILVVGDMAYLSGHGPIGVDGSAIRGRLGDDLDVPAGYEAARRTGLLVLSTLRNHLGSLDRVRRLVKTTGFVQASPLFTEHPAVINGFSELMRDVFGPEAGVAARSALGVASLPAGWAVEIDAIFEVEP
jgi:enamine deaminase RidA (YjgF/YER057c/UK114 family)